VSTPEKSYRLRRLRPSDLDSYHKNINDRLIGRNMRNVNYPLSMKEARAHLKELMQKNASRPKTFDLFVIEINEECAGIISLGQITINHKAKIGYWLGSKYRGRGIMTDVVKRMTKYWFKKFSLKRIEAYVVIFNKGSARVLEKCGYRLECITKKNRLKNGKYYDEYQYAIIR